MDRERGADFSFSPVEDFRKEGLEGLRQLLIVAAMLAATTVLNIFLAQIIHLSSLVFVYLVPTIAAAIYLGNRAAVSSFLCGFLIFDYLYTEPYHSLYISKPQDIYNVSVYFIIAVLIVYLIHLVRRQNAFLKDRLDRVSLIEEMSRDFLSLIPIEQPSPGQSLPGSLRTRVLSQLGDLALKYVRMILNVPALVFFQEEDGSLRIWAKSSIDLEITEEEKEAAAWTARSGEVAGAGTRTHAGTPFYFIPMRSLGEIIGVLGILYNSEELFPEQRRFLGTICNLTTIVAARWLSLNFNKD